MNRIEPDDERELNVAIRNQQAISLRSKEKGTTENPDEKETPEPQFVGDYN